MNETLSKTVVPEGEPLPFEWSFVIDSLPVRVFPDQQLMAEAAACETGAYLVERLRTKETVRLILATGNSQILFLSRLIETADLDWSRVELFHMDEYLGLSDRHSASFRRYMKERVENVARPGVFHYLDGTAQMPLEECRRYEALLTSEPIDLCCLGVGENGHLAFNDPHVADFDDRRMVKLVQLDEACKQQQVGEGHFPSLESVPGFAYTLTIPALCSAEKMVCLAPELRKSQAIKAALEGPVSTDCPASILRRQKHASLYLDNDSASLLNRE